MLNPFLSDERTMLTGYSELHFSAFIFKSLRLLNLWEALLNPEVKRRKNIQIFNEVTFFTTKGNPSVMCILIRSTNHLVLLSCSLASGLCESRC